MSIGSEIMTNIRINRTKITEAISLYILSWFGVLFLIFSLKQYLGENFQTAALYMFVTVFYMPLNVVVMFLMDTPMSITIPGIISSLVIFHYVSGHIDFTIDL